MIAITREGIAWDSEAPGRVLLWHFILFQSETDRMLGMQIAAVERLERENCVKVTVQQAGKALQFCSL